MQPRRPRPSLAIAAIALAPCFASASDLPEGYWTAAQARAVLDRTVSVRLAPDLAALSPGERAAVEALLEAGGHFQSLYEVTRHRQALEAQRRLRQLHATRQGSPETTALLDLYRLFQGPIATTLENHEEPFLPVDAPVPGKNVYPWGIARGEIDAQLERHPETGRALLDPHTAVRRLADENLLDDLATLSAYPGLRLLHPGLAERLGTLLRHPGDHACYAAPYSVAWADDLVEASRLVYQAAEAVRDEDPDLAAYLRLRSRDLLTDDYEAGDAAWVSGRFGHLNAQIGAYETYDDELLGVKAFFGLSVLVRDERASAELSGALAGLQAIEDALPYAAPHRRVREDVPVGVYDVVADFGQARGRNTATILPNDPVHTRKYGRTILLRRNIIMDPALFEIAHASWTAALAPEHHAELDPEGSFLRTLWHEVGHYLGPDRDPGGRSLDEALQEDADLIEEMKSDLVSLFAAERLHAQGRLDARQWRRVQAAGILRVLQKTRPRRSQPYQTMQLMQMNFFLDRGLLAVAADGSLRIRYDRYRPTVTALLREVLAIQQRGDKPAADAFIERWSGWSDELHERLAARMREAERYRYALVRYAALGE